MEDEKKQQSTIVGVVFTGCLFIGLGLGIYFNQVAVGVLVGMGVGFIGMGIMWAITRHK